MDLEKLKYPIGKFKRPEAYTKQLINGHIETIETFPGRLKKEVERLSESQLDTSYRENGWTIRQVVHHCADSHVNAFIRVKLALTEIIPTVKPYMEDRWAELADSKKLPIEPSLKVIEGLHERWSFLLKTLNEADLQRTFIHPEQKREVGLNEVLCLYAWHCDHHLAHITGLKQRMDWK